MAGLTLKSLLSRRSGNLAVVGTMLETLGGGVGVVDASGALVMGVDRAGASRIPIAVEEGALGFVVGPVAIATAVATLIQQLAAKEAENRSLAGEVLHLYREVHLIEQLSEQLAALLNAPAVSESALAQAQRLISASHGCLLIMDQADGSLHTAACFGPQGAGALAPNSQFAASVLERGIAEIVNDYHTDGLHALMCAPLRAGQRTAGVIALASDTEGASYTAADLKLLNTIALQTAAALENAFLCAEMVETARERAAFTAELQAASSVQQLLLQGASRATPGFAVESVYLPASEVGGDFFLLSCAPDGALVAIVGDVSGKGLTAAMRVALILGALRRETSFDPGEILAGLNNALILQAHDRIDQLGFTTACCVRVSLTGEFAVANAGHLAPYVAGRELATAPALPLGLVADQRYELLHGRLLAGERLVLLSDGVVEARSAQGELYGFERMTALSLLPAQQIADAAQSFGQEDDITVLRVGVAVP
jgi:serine phosphatase RsbU (regulator of sigma subunit)